MFGLIIKDKRQKLNIKASDLANSLDIDVIQIYRWEKETTIPSLDYLLQLCNLLDINMNDLSDGGINDLSFQFQERLKEKRTSDGCNMMQYASILNISRQTYSKWESGESLPNIDVFYQLTKTLNLQPSYFFGATIEASIPKDEVVVNDEIEPKKRNKLVFIIPAIATTALVLIGIIISIHINNRNSNKNSDELIETPSSSQSINYKSSVAYTKDETLSDEKNDSIEQLIIYYNSMEVAEEDEPYCKLLLNSAIRIIKRLDDDQDISTKTNELLNTLRDGITLRQERYTNLDDLISQGLRVEEIAKNIVCEAANVINLDSINATYTSVRSKIINTDNSYDITMMLDAFISECTTYINLPISNKQEEAILLVRNKGEKLYLDVIALVTDQYDIKRVEYAYNYFKNALSSMSGQSFDPSIYYLIFKDLMYENIYDKYEFTKEEYIELADYRAQQEISIQFDSAGSKKRMRVLAKTREYINSIEDIEDLKLLVLNIKDKVLSIGNDQ